MNTCPHIQGLKYGMYHSNVGLGQYVWTHGSRQPINIYNCIYSVDWYKIKSVCTACTG